MVDSAVQCWCERWDSNPHGGRHTHLKRACLPFQHSRKCAPTLYPPSKFLSTSFSQDYLVVVNGKTLWYNHKKNGG